MFGILRYFIISVTKIYTVEISQKDNFDDVVYACHIL